MWTYQTFHWTIVFFRRVYHWYISLSFDHTGLVNDTQLYVAVSLFFSCILDIKSWISQNVLQLKQDKTELWFKGSVIFESDLNFKAHVHSATKIAFYHLKNILQVMAFLSLSNTESLMHALTNSKLNYCNVFFSGLLKNTINQLQLIIISAARVLTKTRGRARITSLVAYKS